MSYEELEQKVMDYFGDTSRSAAQTKNDLEALAEKCTMLADTIDVGSDDE